MFSSLVPNLSGTDKSDVVISGFLGMLVVIFVALSASKTRSYEEFDEEEREVDERRTTRGAWSWGWYVLIFAISAAIAFIVLSRLRTRGGGGSSSPISSRRSIDGGGENVIFAELIQNMNKEPPAF
jgi:hypothetical protein